MPELITQSTVVSRKEYNCDGCICLLNLGSTQQLIEELNLTKEESEVLMKAKEDGFKILKGQTYLKQVLKDGGFIYSCRIKPEIYDLINKYDLFHE
jgi:hypothetical protein